MQRFVWDNEGKRFTLTSREWEEIHGITLAFITFNEEDYIADFLKVMRPLVNRIVMVDSESTDRTVEIAEPLVDAIKVIPFNGHYANQKNNAIKMSYTDWTLFVDPDERLGEGIIKNLRGYIESDEYDCYSFPRREIIDGKEHLDKYPSYQDRLFRTYCRYVRPIHHELVGYKNKMIIPMDAGLDIIHNKTMIRHMARNTGYTLFERHNLHEMGQPGSQQKESFFKQYPHFAEKLFMQRDVKNV